MAVDDGGPAYAAHFPDVRQTGPDSFETFTRIRTVTPDTTVGELLNWYRSFCSESADVRFEISAANRFGRLEHGKRG